LRLRFSSSARGSGSWEGQGQPPTSAQKFTVRLIIIVIIDCTNNTTSNTKQHHQQRLSSFNAHNSRARSPPTCPVCTYASPVCAAVTGRGRSRGRRQPILLLQPGRADQRSEGARMSRKRMRQQEWAAALVLPDCICAVTAVWSERAAHLANMASAFQHVTGWRCAPPGPPLPIHHGPSSSDSHSDP